MTEPREFYIGITGEGQLYAFHGLIQTVGITLIKVREVMPDDEVQKWRDHVWQKVFFVDGHEHITCLKIASHYNKMKKALEKLEKFGNEDWGVSEIARKALEE